MPVPLADHIVVLTDGSQLANEVLPLARVAIEACRPRQVTLMRVLEPAVASHPGRVDAIEWAIVRSEAESGLQQLAHRLELGETQVRPVVAEGRAADQILHFCAGHAVDLVVLASHGRGAADRWALGGTARKVVVRGGPSFLIVPVPRSIRSTTLRRILIPLDCSTRAEAVLPLVTRLALAHEAEVLLAHVVQEPELPRRVDVSQRDRDLAAQLVARTEDHAREYLGTIAGRSSAQGVRARICMRSDASVVNGLRVLIAEENPDLVLTCAHGAACRADDPYGSVTARLMETVDRPLWIVQDLPAPARERMSTPQRLHSGLAADG